MPITQPGSKDARAYAAGYFELELDGEEVGILNAVDGGHFKSEPIGQAVGHDAQVSRYPGRQKFEDINITCGSIMSPAFWRWVEESIARNPTRRSGAIIARDYDMRERSRRTFKDAILSEIQFPLLDAKSKSPKYITVKLAPELLEYKVQTAGRPQTMKVGDVPKQKKSIPQNFGVRIDGIDTLYTKRVHKVDAFAVKQHVINAPVGPLLYAPKEIGRIEFPTITLYAPETYAQPWFDWWQEFVGRGNHSPEKERTGEIHYMDSTFSQTLLTINLSGVGITGITFEKHDGHTENVRTVKIDLYVEGMKLKAG